MATDGDCLPLKSGSTAQAQRGKIRSTSSRRAGRYKLRHDG
jgi:hypothetical protein